MKENTKETSRKMFSSEEVRDACKINNLKRNYFSGIFVNLIKSL